MKKEKKQLLVLAVILLVVIAVGVTVYGKYKDSINPDTGDVADATDAGTTSPSDPSGSPETSGSAAVSAVVDPAPDFTMEDADGNEVGLSDYTGTPVILNFWTSWCGYCKEEMSYFEEAYVEYGDRIQFIMLNAVTNEYSTTSGTEYIESMGYTFPVFYDVNGEGLSQYDLRGFPTTVFIYADGSIAYTNPGLISETKLYEKIDLLLGE